MPQTGQRLLGKFTAIGWIEALEMPFMRIETESQKAVLVNNEVWFFNESNFGMTKDNIFAASSILKDVANRVNEVFQQGPPGAVK